MKSLIFDLNLPAQEVERYYQGTKTVSALSRDGKRVEFPANILHKFITRTGISGTFEIFFDDDNRFQSIVKR